MKWWEDSITEELSIVALIVIAVSSLASLGVEGKEIVIAIGSGIIGYLAKTVKEK